MSEPGPGDCGGGGGGRGRLSGLFAALLDLGINARAAGLGPWGREGQQDAQGRREAGEESPGPVGVAEERAGGQHGVGKHPCGEAIYAIQVLNVNRSFDYH